MLAGHEVPVRLNDKSSPCALTGIRIPLFTCHGLTEGICRIAVQRHDHIVLVFQIDIHRVDVLLPLLPAIPQSSFVIGTSGHRRNNVLSTIGSCSLPAILLSVIWLNTGDLVRRILLVRIARSKKLVHSIHQKPAEHSDERRADSSADQGNPNHGTAVHLFHRRFMPDPANRRLTTTGSSSLTVVF